MQRPWIRNWFCNTLRSDCTWIWLTVVSEGENVLRCCWKVRWDQHWTSHKLWVSAVAQIVRSLPARQETWIQSLGWEDLLEMRMATQSSILAWRFPWIRNLMDYSPWDHKELDTTEELTLPTFTFINCDTELGFILNTVRRHLHRQWHDWSYFPFLPSFFSARE